MSKHQIKGILISILFVVAGFIASRYGIDLGRFFWIVIVVVVVLAAIYFSLWVAIKALRGKPGKE